MPTRKPAPARKYISRVDRPYTHGYVVRFVIRATGQHYQKYFADADHGGKRRALAAAKAHRNAMAKEHGLNLKYQYAPSVREKKEE